MKNPHFRVTKKITFVLLSIFVAGGFAFLMYQTVFAEFSAPCDTPPFCQPDAVGAGGGNLYDVLNGASGNPIAATFGALTDTLRKGIVAIGGGKLPDGTPVGRVLFGLGTSTPGFPLDIISQKRETGQTEADRDTALIRLGYNADSNTIGQTIKPGVYTGLRLDRNSNKNQNRWFLGMKDDTDNFVLRRSTNGDPGNSVDDVTVDASGLVHACVGSFLVGLSTRTSDDVNIGNYKDADGACAETFSASHVCTTAELLKTIQCTDPNTTFNAVNDQKAWIDNGPPAYTENVNDCQGWTSADSLDYGTYWHFDKNGGGAGYIADCSTIGRKFACCH